jgi:hypothetical protein
LQKQVEYLHKLTEEGQQVLEKLVGEAKKERQTEAKNNNNKEISLNTYIYTYIPPRATLRLGAARASGFGLKFRQHQIHLCLPQDLLAV